MKYLNVFETDASLRVTKLLVAAIIGFTSLFVLSLAYTASAATLTRQLEQGMKGEDVSALQAYLAQDNTIYPQGLVTGYFGTLTTSAVSNFQARNGIATVGRVGPVTMAALNLKIGGNVVGSDTYAPSISSLNVGVSSNSATFNWNTNENSSAIIYYGTSFPNMIEGGAGYSVTVGGLSYLVHTDLLSSHNAVINSLNPNTTYYYVVYVRDGSGNETITWPNTFHTNQ